MRTEPSSIELSNIKLDQWDKFKEITIHPNLNDIFLMKVFHTDIYYSGIFKYMGPSSYNKNIMKLSKWFDHRWDDGHEWDIENRPGIALWKGHIKIAQPSKLIELRDSQEWKIFKNNMPGECPCGTNRNVCNYHK